MKYMHWCMMKQSGMFVLHIAMNTAFAVDCMQYVCERNDKYINGVFFKADGVTVIDRLPTDKEEIQQLRADNAQLTVAMADIIGGAV